MITHLSKLTKPIQGLKKFNFFSPYWILPLVFTMIGTGIYFILPFEPDINIGMGGLCIAAMGYSGSCVFVAYGSHRYWPVIKTITIPLVFMMMGFLAAQWRCMDVAAPVLAHPIPNTHIEGRVILIEPIHHRFRLTLDQVKIDRLLSEKTPLLIRVHVDSIDNIKVGYTIHASASLFPPAAPSRVHGYDFQRHAYFQQWGAGGYLLDVKKITDDDHPTSWSQKMSLKIASWRHQLGQRIIQTQPNNAGGFIVALLTGFQGYMDDETQDQMRIAGLVHLVAVSGFNLALASGLLFVITRRFLSFFRHPWLDWHAKRIAASVGFLGATFYMLMAGATHPTLRAFVMTGFFLIAICTNRQLINLRSLSMAGMIIVLVYPESITNPGFQLSLAATFGLIVLHQGLYQNHHLHILQWSSWVKHTTFLLLSSVVAYLFTAPIVAYHFHQLSPYSVLANVLAGPMMACWITPLCLLSLLLSPFGMWEKPLDLAASGIHVLFDISKNIASWPHALWPIPDFSWLICIGFIIITAWIMLHPNRLRMMWGCSAIGVIMVAAVWLTLPPTIVVSNDAKTIAVRHPTDSTYTVYGQLSPFAARDWQYFLSNSPPPQPLPSTLVFDKLGHWQVTHLTPHDIHPDALFLINTQWPKRAVHVPSVHKKLVEQFGAYTIWLDRDKISVVHDRHHRGDRPWVTMPDANSKKSRKQHHAPHAP